METFNIEVKEVVLNNILENKNGDISPSEIKMNVFEILGRHATEIEKAKVSLNESLYRLLSQCYFAHLVVKDWKAEQKFPTHIGERVYNDYLTLCSKNNTSDAKKANSLHRICEFVFPNIDKTNISRYAKALKLFDEFLADNADKDFAYFPTWVSLEGGIQEVCGSDKSGEKKNASNADVMKKVLCNSNNGEFTADISFTSKENDKNDESGYVVIIAVKDGNNYIVKSATQTTKSVNSALSSVHAHYSSKVRELKQKQKEIEEFGEVMENEEVVEMELALS